MDPGLGSGGQVTDDDAIEFGVVVRVAPLGILLIALATMRTVLWSDSR